MFSRLQFFMLMTAAAVIYVGFQIWQEHPRQWPAFTGDPFGTFYLTNPKTIRDLTNISKENGGWRLLPSKSDWEKYAVHRCDFDRKNSEDLTAEVFEKEYRYKRPLLIYFSQGASGWTNASVWTLPALLSSYGDREIGTGRGTDFYIHFGHGHYRMTLKDYLAYIMEVRDISNEPFYLFDKMFYNTSDLPDSVHLPEYLQFSRSDETRFYLGATLSGASFHRHADALNGLVFGWKRWFLYPPEQTPPGGVQPGLNIMEWYNGIYPNISQKLKPLECMQGPGDIIYIPESWYHGTFNLGDTVSVGYQKFAGALPMQNLTTVCNKQSLDKNIDVQKRLEKVYELLEKLHARYPLNTEIMLLLGQTYMFLCDFRNGLTMALRILEHDSTFSMAHALAGKAYLGMGDLIGAERHLKRVSEMIPNNPGICWLYGRFLVYLGRGDEAISWFEKGARDHMDRREFFKSLVEQTKDLLGRK